MGDRKRRNTHGIFGRWLFVQALALGAILGVAEHAIAQRTPAFEERVAAQEAIERVYYHHRIWPKENPDAKPAFEAVMPRSVLIARAEDALRKSAALASFWGRPLTNEQLQAEMDRMAADTKDPATLNELFAALNNDPDLIAECLVRPILADREIRKAYACDARFHGAQKEAILRELETLTAEKAFQGLSGRYSESEIVIEDGQEGDPGSMPDPGTRISLPRDEWERMASSIRMKAALTPGEGRGNRAPLQEDEVSFYIIRILDEGEGSLRYASVRWAKRSFEDWWSESREGFAPATEFPAASYTISQIRGGTRAVDTWTSMRCAPPAPRYNHTAVWTGSEMIIWGGINGSYGFAGGSRYDPATDTWLEIVSTGSPSVREGHTAVWTGTQMIIFGGRSGSTYYSDGKRYDPAADTWTTMTGFGLGRTGHTAVWSGTQMLLWGGYNPSWPYYTNAGGRYNPSSNSWTSMSQTGAPAARYNHIAVVAGNEMIVWGGYGCVNPPGCSVYGYLNTGGRYDLTTGLWSAMTTTGAPAGRTQGTGVWTGTQLVVWGGFDGTSRLNTGGRYTPSPEAWAPTETTGAPAARSEHTAVWSNADSAMIIWGGTCGTGCLASGGAKFLPGTNAWSAVTAVGAPDARQNHTAIWTGTLMIVWGGRDGTGALNTGARYNAASDEWTPTSSFWTPSPRMYHTAVWSGVEMVVWGGWGGILPELNTGGRYLPVLDVWTATTSAGAPVGRQSHVAVWTGSRMILWGGYAGGSRLNTGGLYDPALDVWTATTLNNAPQARETGGTIWTGKEMIVWGGYTFPPAAYLNTGGRYDPVLDRWTTMSTAGAPTARSGFAAAWTGTQYLVWGGYNGSSYFNTGGRYTPSTDTWLPINTTGAPSARSAPSGIWTGTQMVVWGGLNGLLNYNSGGRYDPVANTWTATSTTGAPTARSSHAAVWTGARMIVWGGQDQWPNRFNTGGRYDPAGNSWAATSTTSAPGPRTFFAGVWTGFHLIVWGGSGASLIGGGGLYEEVPSTDLVLTLAESADPVFLGDPLTYTLTIKNASVTQATNVALSNTYPAGVSLDNVTPSQGTCNTSGNPVTCALGTLAAGASATVAIQIMPSVEATLTDAASVSSTETDFYLPNNQLQEITLALTSGGDYDGDGSPNNADCKPADNSVWAAPGAFNLLYPSNAAVDVPLSPTLDWADAPPAGNAVRYTLYFGTTSPAPFYQTNLMTSQLALSNLGLFTTYYWRVVAYNACGTVSLPEFSFRTVCPNPGAFGVTYPADGATGTDVSLTLNWQDSQYAATYDLYFGTSPSPVLYQAGIAASQVAVSGLAIDTLYYWRVVAVNFCGTTSSIEWSFTTACYSPRGFMLGSPSNQSTDVPWDVPFDWADATFADTYNLYLGTAYPPPLYQSGITASDLFVMGLHPDMTHYWRVEAVNHCGSTFSETWSFTTQCNPPQPFNLLAPPDTASGVSVNAPLDWEDEPNASSYALFLGTASPPPLFRQGILSSALEVPGLLVNQTYYWRVEARTSCGNSSSAEWSFSTAPAGVTFIDDAGAPVEEFPEDVRAYLRVQDPAADLNAFAPDTVGVTVSSSYGADAEPLTLTETGNTTGVFEGSIALAFGAGTPDGILQTGNSGAPDWFFDTLTAAYGVLTDTARTAGSTTTLLHDDGRDAAAYAIGWPVRVRVEDHAIGGPATIDTATVTLRTLTSLDEETLLLTETGPATGVFEGSIASRIAAPTPGDGTLQATPTETLRAWHVNAHSPTESSDTAFMQASLVEFIDAEGLHTETFVESTRVFVRIYDSWGNWDPEAADEVTATLYSEIAGDEEYFFLPETGINTGIFERSLPMALAGGDPSNGVLETAELVSPYFAFDTLRVWYWDDISAVDEDFASTVGSRTLFVDDLGGEAESYPIGSLVRLRVLDGNRNTNPALVDTSQASVWALGTGDTETVALTETGLDTGWFTGSLPTQKNGSSSPGDGTLQAQAGETIQAEHDDLMGWSFSHDSALITAASIEFIGADGAPAEVYMESTRAYVRVFDSAANMNSGMPESTTATLSSLYGLDAEQVILTETGDNTNVFEGSIALEFGSASLADGILQTGNSGPPAWLFDTLTATHDTAVDTARTMGSRTVFVDAYGRETAAYPVGSRIYLRVEDHNANDPMDIDSASAVLQTANGDSETLLLRETGPATGVFEGSLPSTFGWPSVGDGTLQAVDFGETITAIHMDANGPTTSSDTALFIEAIVEFIDAAGAPTEVVLESSRVYLRVIAPYANTDPGGPEFVNAGVSSLITGDQAWAELWETGDNTGIFEGSFPMDLGTAWPNFTLETYETPPPAFSFDRLTAMYPLGVGEATDTAVTLGSRTWFMDGSGRIAESYPIGAVVRLRVLDFNWNDPLTVDTVQVRVRSLGTGDDELITLTETGQDTGEFTGSLATQNSGTPSIGDGTLQALAGETILAEHEDFLGWSQSVDTAVITAYSVEFIGADGDPAGEYLENTRAYVRVFDQAANGNATAPDTTWAMASSLYGADSEPLTLTETGDDTNVFEGSIVLELGAAAPGDGTLQTGQSGPSQWEFDTLTVTHGPLPDQVSDTAVTVGSRTTFINAAGAETDAYALGGAVHVRVENHTLDQPGIVDQVLVMISTLTTGDRETFYLTETGTDTALFEGFILSEAGPPALWDNSLQAQVGETVFAEHFDCCAELRSTDTAVIVEAAVEFIDAAGISTEAYAEGTRVYLRVFSPLANGDPEAINSVWVEVQSLIAGDWEGLTLMETGPDTGVFEGSIPMAVGPGNPWNSTLETDENPPPAFSFDTLTATYAGTIEQAVDTAATVGSFTRFTNAAGVPVEAYDIGAIVHVEVLDQRANGNPGSAETTPVLITAPLSGDQETVICVETGPDTGIFRGSIPSQAAPSGLEDGNLTVQAGETVTAEHDDLLGWSSSTDTAFFAPALLLMVQKSGPEDLFLDWNDAPMEFEVVRSTSPDMASPLIRRAGTSQLTDPGVLPDGVNYYYLVRVDIP